LGLKENIEAVKKEISTEEQFLESIIKGERFFKKHKKTIIAILIVALLSVLAYSVFDYIKKSKLEAANEAYVTLLQNPQDKEALQKLSDNNKRLYNFFLFVEALKEKNSEKLEKLAALKDDPIIADLALYQFNSMNARIAEESELLKGMALLQAGYKLLLENKIEEAKLKFAQIALNSPLKNIANSLEHYQGK
jgi:hypothetical protein